MPLHRLLRLLVVSASLAIAFAPEAAAQLDLPSAPPKSSDKDKAPKKPDKPSGRSQRGNLVRHLVCTVCYERNYTSPLSSVGENGLANVYCKICRRQTFHKPSSAEKKGGELDLPSGGVSTPSTTPATPTGTQPKPPVGVGTDRAAAFIFDEVKRARTFNDTLALRAVDSIIALGEPGYAAARVALFEDNAAACMCAARVLLRSPVAADRELVAQRLRGRLPAKVGPRLVVEVVREDPVHGGPRLLAELLDHSQTPVRNAAFRELSDQMNVDLLEEVANCLSSKRASTRARAVALLSQLEDSLTDDLLFPHLGDPSARVAGSVAVTLGLSRDSAIDQRLLNLAFADKWILRDSCYALLALIQREDAELRAILTENHAPALLTGLDSSDPFVAGVCATALSGIGFRSPDVLGTDWLEQRVPETMIATVSGKSFHNDFASLQPHTLRRLALITGEDIGSDGPRWVRWWLENHEGFYAHRAHLFVDPERIGTLTINYKSLGDPVEWFSLVGADLAKAAHEKPLRGAEQIFLSREECADVISLLRTEGVLGAERLPGTVGARGRGERTLEILIDGHGKEFFVGQGQGEPWFDRVVVAIRSMRDRGEWQRYPDPAKYADSYSFWLEERLWWTPDRSEVERVQRLKEHLMTWITAQRLTQRSQAITKLAEIYARDGVPAANDYAFFRDRIQEERFFGPRAGDLLALALTSARLSGQDGLVPKEMGKELSTTLSETFGPGAVSEIAQVLRTCGFKYVREVAESETPLMRSIAATVLAKSDSPEDREILMKMLEDPSEDVQVAAMLAMGEQRIEDGRTELLVRARFAPREIRVAAIRSVAMLGGEFVFDALVAGRSDPDPMVRAAAVEGLAILGDPRAAPLLITLLAKGEESPTFQTAWDGLLRMGQAAHTDLLQAMYSPTHRARRQATMLLARQMEPLAVSTMIAMITDTPNDRKMLQELAILTCVDFSAAKDSSLQWWDWWDTVVHDDSLAWFRGAAEIEDRSPPPANAFRQGGTREGALFLVSMLDHEAPQLRERARRELEIMLGHTVSLAPKNKDERELWIASMRKLVLDQWET